MAHKTSESARRAVEQRWHGTTPEQRSDATLAARKARGRVKDVEEKVDALGDVLLTELRALRAEVERLGGPRGQDREQTPIAA